MNYESVNSPVGGVMQDAASEPKSWKFAHRGWWLVAIQLVLYDIANRLSLHLRESLRFAAGDHPDKSPPWYFIRRDAITAGCFLGALAICIAVAVLARKRYPIYANMLAWMSVLWFGGNVWRGIVILFSTHDLLRPETATTRWSTFESYLYDPLILSGQLGVYVLTFAIVGAGYKNFRRPKDGA